MAGVSRAAWAVFCACAIASHGHAQLSARSSEAVERRSAERGAGAGLDTPSDAVVVFGPPVEIESPAESAPAPAADLEPLLRDPGLGGEPAKPEPSESAIDPGSADSGDVASIEQESTPAEAAPHSQSRSLGVPQEPASLPLPESSGSTGAGAWISKVAAPLIGVLSLAVGGAWLFKKAAGAQGGLAGAIGPGGRAPSGVLEVLGRYPVARGCTLVLLKLDRRVLLLSQSAGGRGGAATFTTLAELDTPEDVASILMKTRAADGEAIESRFAEALEGFSSEPPASLVEVKDTDSEPGPAERALARIRARAASLGFGPTDEGAR